MLEAGKVVSSRASQNRPSFPVPAQVDCQIEPIRLEVPPQPLKIVIVQGLVGRQVSRLRKIERDELVDLGHE